MVAVEVGKEDPVDLLIRPAAGLVGAGQTLTGIHEDVGSADRVQE
jgi:hypothetical protein